MAVQPASNAEVFAVALVLLKLTTSVHGPLSLSEI